MSWRDRPYARNDLGYPSRRPVYRGPGLHTVSVTTIIIIANAAVFVLMFFVSQRLGKGIFDLGAMRARAVLNGQIWRLFTATYMHINLGHILLNMLGLYFLGPALERVWGPRQFFLVYTLGGVAGNALLTAAGAVGFIDPNMPGLGASGSVLTLLGAATVLFPDAEVYVYFLFPVRIQTFALLYGLWFVYNIIHQGRNYGGDMCHLAGLLIGLGWAYSGGVSLSGRHRTRVEPSSLIGRLLDGVGTAPRPRHDEMLPPPASSPPPEQTVDRILAKIAEQGFDRLTEEEKRILTAATARRRGSNPG